jgi:acetyltransferase
MPCADALAPGHVGFMSQSGAICTSVLDWSRSQGVGFSAFVSIGSMLDVGWGLSSPGWAMTLKPTAA